MEDDNLMNTLTTAGAGAAVVSPWWLPVIHHINAGAAWLLPVLGCTWLIIQIAYKLTGK